MLYPREKKKILRLIIYYSSGLFSYSLCGGKSNLRAICFSKWNAQVLHYQLLLICAARSAWGGFVFPPKIFAFFQRLRKTLRNYTNSTQRPFPGKRLGCPLTPRVPHLHLSTIAACASHSFSASSQPLTAESSAAHPELRVLYFQTRTGPWLTAGRSQLPLSGGLPRPSSEPSTYASPLHCSCCPAAGSAMLVFLPFSPLTSQKAPILMKCNFAPWVERNDH